MSKKKTTIPKIFKQLVWNKYIGDHTGIGNCQCCKQANITQMSFHCGHIISEFNGGKVTLDNCKPICPLCNSSMGTKNMNEFMAEYGFDKIVQNLQNDAHNQSMSSNNESNKCVPPPTDKINVQLNQYEKGENSMNDFIAEDNLNKIVQTLQNDTLNQSMQLNESTKYVTPSMFPSNAPTISENLSLLKKYQCKYCLKDFSRQDVLKKHVNKHCKKKKIILTAREELLKKTTDEMEILKQSYFQSVEEIGILKQSYSKSVEEMGILKQSYSRSVEEMRMLKQSSSQLVEEMGILKRQYIHPREVPRRENIPQSINIKHNSGTVISTVNNVKNNVHMDSVGTENLDKNMADTPWKKFLWR